MVLQQKEIDALRDLQTQEQSCVEKYKRYANMAKDPELRNLFQTIQKAEQQHFDSLGQALKGDVPQSDCNDYAGKNYHPNGTYKEGEMSEDKKADAFLVTDCIGTEKLVSSEYNSNVFKFASDAIRRLLADIQVEEQNHAEMLNKYKLANCMS